MVNSKLQTAIDALRALDNTEDMHVLASHYYSHVNFLRKQ